MFDITRQNMFDITRQNMFDITRQNMFDITRFCYTSGFFSISISYSIYFINTGVTKIVRYTKGFIIKRFVKSRFHCK